MKNGVVDSLGTIANNSFGTIVNNGTLTNRSMFTNDGTLVNNPSATLANNGSFTNTGNVVISAGSTLSNAAGSSYVQTAGQTIVDGTLNSVPAVQIQGGLLSGTGTINGGLFNSGGIVQPGDAPGTLTINGNYTQGPGGTLTIDLGGTAPGQFSVLDVTGAATLDGTVDFVALAGFAPVAGDDFTFLLFGSESGNFANIEFTNWTCPVGDTCKDVFGPGSLTLEITSGSTPVPEPSSLLLLGTGLLGTGLLGLGTSRYRRREQSA